MSSARISKRVGAGCLAGAILVCGGIRASAQSLVRESDGTVSIHAADARLSQLLRELSAVTAFQKLSVAPEIESRLVTLTLDRVSVRQALVAVLNSVEADFVVLADDEGKSVRVVAVSRSGAPAAPVHAADPPRTAVPEETPPEVLPDPTVDAQLQDLLQKALSRPPAARSGPIVLPFPGPDGSPLIVPAPAGNEKQTLPFPDDLPDSIRALIPPGVDGTPPPSAPTPGAPPAKPKPKGSR